jgi:dGTPase
MQNEEEFRTKPSDKNLLELSKGQRLRDLLKDFAFRHAYKHRSVLCIELEGYNVIRGLMDMFWAAITDRSKADVPGSDRQHPFTRLVYARISENYRRFFESPPNEMKGIPLRYRECLLLTDMISGMTDRFAVDLHAELTRLIGPFKASSYLQHSA